MLLVASNVITRISRIPLLPLAIISVCARTILNIVFVFKFACVCLSVSVRERDWNRLWVCEKRMLWAHFPHVFYFIQNTNVWAFWKNGAGFGIMPLSLFHTEVFSLQASITQCDLAQKQIYLSKLFLKSINLFVHGNGHFHVLLTLFETIRKGTESIAILERTGICMKVFVSAGKRKYIRNIELYTLYVVWLQICSSIQSHRPKNFVR